MLVAAVAPETTSLGVILLLHITALGRGPLPPDHSDVTTAAAPCCTTSSTLTNLLYNLMSFGVYIALVIHIPLKYEHNVIIDHIFIIINIRKIYVKY